MNKSLKLMGQIAVLALSLVIVSCNNDDDSDNNTTFSAENAALAAKTDATVDGTMNILETGYDENVDGNRNAASLFPECTVITIVTSGNGGTITLDFGDGCQLNNGATVTGLIELQYGPIDGGTRTIDYTFQDFTYNNNGVEGGGQIVRTIANQDGNPQSTVNETITVSFPNTEVTATRVGERISEWVEGVGSGTWLDNVFHITGNWNTTFTNGFERDGEVTETLVWKLNCLYFVSGVIEVTQEGFTGGIDYGNGECDNLATLIINGQEYPIFL
ncbi:MAG: hypothetical protein HKN48_07725 [Flavobacteriaceae bacterium]|nr:hypothetical protein [Flavobacteriaceae bacterium]